MRDGYSTVGADFSTHTKNINKTENHHFVLGGDISDQSIYQYLKLQKHNKN